MILQILPALIACISRKLLLLLSPRQKLMCHNRGTLYSQNNITDVVRAEQLKNTFIRAFPKSSEEVR